MIFFNTRRKLKELERAIELVAINQSHFSRTFIGAVEYVDAAQKKLDEYDAQMRKFSGMTFKAEEFFAEPDYGSDWSEEEKKLNEKRK